MPNAQCPTPNAGQYGPNAGPMPNDRTQPSACQCSLLYSSGGPMQASGGPRQASGCPMQAATEEGLRLAASMRLGEGDALDLNWERRAYDPRRAYVDSKACMPPSYHPLV